MAKFLESGTYQVKTEKVVTVWPKPDPDGDGDFLYRDVLGPDGELLGQEIVVTDDGREVKHYLPPEGFRNMPSKEPGANGNANTYVRLNGQGGVLRNHHGQAVVIREGTALVEHPDGTFEVLETDYHQVLFGRAHDRVPEGK